MELKARTGRLGRGWYVDPLSGERLRGLGTGWVWRDDGTRASVGGPQTAPSDQGWRVKDLLPPETRWRPPPRTPKRWLPMAMGRGAPRDFSRRANPLGPGVGSGVFFFLDSPFSRRRVCTASSVAAPLRGSDRIGFGTARRLKSGARPGPARDPPILRGPAGPKPGACGRNPRCRPRVGRSGSTMALHGHFAGVREGAGRIGHDEKQHQHHRPVDPHASRRGGGCRRPRRPRALTPGCGVLGSPSSLMLRAGSGFESNISGVFASTPMASSSGCISRLASKRARRPRLTPGA